MSGTKTMQAVLLTGKPTARDAVVNLLKLGEVPRPVISAKQVLVKVKATAVNIEDIMTAVGRRPLVSLTATQENPVVLGQEFSGVIEEIGANVTKFKVGDPVLGHKLPFRVRFGSWAEYVAVGADVLVHKPEKYTYAEAAALPMSAAVAYAAVNTAGLFDKPANQVKVNPGLEMKEVRDGVLTFQEDKLNSATIAVIGASSTVGSIVVSMLAARGFNVVGVCSAGNGEAVLRNGAVGVLDRNKGGLKLKGEMKLDIVIDAVGGQVAEDSGREALEGSGHFITVVGPTEFGEGTDGGMKNIGNGMSITSRKMKSMFSSVKYSLASMPLYVRDILEKLVEEGVSVILDSEVELLNEEAVKTAIDKVRLHKTRGRLVLVNN